MKNKHLQHHSNHHQKRQRFPVNVQPPPPQPQPPKKLELQADSDNASDSTAVSFSKKAPPRNKHHCKTHCAKYRRSASITTNHSSELDQFRKNRTSAECWKDSLSPNRIVDGNQDVVGDSAAGAGAASALPRTLSTSVLRIKHKRNFWERFTRFVVVLFGCICTTFFLVHSSPF